MKFLLNKYKSIVIKSTNSYVVLYLCGVNYITNQNWIYLLYLPKNEQCFITLNSNIDIYVNENLELNKLLNIVNVCYKMSIVDFRNIKSITSNYFWLYNNQNKKKKSFFMLILKNFIIYMKRYSLMKFV